ncbi:MAG TPA: hypothetical protein VH442_06870, partial [Micromonosporaceae bacterium]
DAARTPAFRSAAAAHPDQVKLLTQSSSSGGGSVQDTSFLNHLASALSHPFKVGFAQSTTIVYYIAAAIMVLTLIITFLLPELPLSRQSAAERRQQEGAEALAEAADTSGLPAAAAVVDADAASDAERREPSQRIAGDAASSNGHVDTAEAARTSTRTD